MFFDSSGYRKIIHVDMDAFFASVEQREDPSLKGRPIAVGFNGPRGVVSTASYEARKFGVHSAMSMVRAKQLCPQLVVIPTHFDLYKEVSRQVHRIFQEYTDIIEPISLDEAFLDVTRNKCGIEYAQDIAKEIKQKILQDTSLTASAGVSYNKFLAKIASDYHKPDGLFVVHPLRALNFVAGLPIEKFWGIGPKTAEKMRGLGIFNGAQLREWSLDDLKSHFGKVGQIYYDFARGVDNRPVETERIRKSVGCEETYLTDISDPLEIEAEINMLASELVKRIDKASFKGHTLTLKVKFFDFVQITRSISSKSFISEKNEILELAEELLANVNYSPARPIRLLGLSVSNPIQAPVMSIPAADLYPTLFDDLDD